mmetsp:Transcript_2686/g.8724  ORF Transcript_2686/g.8724 Transcript_2686/m.8724 type:complete len:248 (-) Transcript_2686:2115-2858(-)
MPAASVTVESESSAMVVAVVVDIGRACSLISPPPIVAVVVIDAVESEDAVESNDDTGFVIMRSPVLASALPPSAVKRSPNSVGLVDDVESIVESIDRVIGVAATRSTTRSPYVDLGAYVDVEPPIVVVVVVYISACTYIRDIFLVAQKLVAQQQHVVHRRLDVIRHLFDLRQLVVAGIIRSYISHLRYVRKQPRDIWLSSRNILKFHPRFAHNLHARAHLRPMHGFDARQRRRRVHPQPFLIPVIAR